MDLPELELKLSVFFPGFS